MEFTVATINEILLPPFLFIVVFCFLCCQLPRRRYTTATIQPEVEPIATPQPVAIEEEKTQIEQEPCPAPVPSVEEFACDIGSAPVIKDPATPQPHPLSTEVAAFRTAKVADLKPEPGVSQQPEVYAQALAAIDGLGKREARKMMGGLKLQQKRNGVELSTELMIASIRRELKTDPSRVIEVIRDRLPELLSNATTQPDQLAS